MISPLPVSNKNQPSEPEDHLNWVNREDPRMFLVFYVQYIIKKIFNWMQKKKK